MSTPTVDITRSDLDKLIEETVAKHSKKSTADFEAALDAMRKELSGAEKAEEIAEARDKSRRDFAALKPEQQAKRLQLARSAMFDGSLSGRAQAVSPELKSIGWGDGKLFARYILLAQRAQKEGYHGDNMFSRVMQLAKEAGHADLVDIIESRVLQAGSASGAGAIIPEVFSTDFIAALYAQAVIRRAGAVVLDISERGNMTLGRQNTTATGYWVGENGSITASQGTYGQLKLDAKKLGVFVPVSNDAVRYANGAFNQLVAQDMLRVAALKEDIAFIRGDGTAGTPKGIKNWVASGQGFSADTSGSTAYDKQTTDLIKAQYKVEAGLEGNVERPAWLMNTREKFGLMLTKTGDSATFAFGAEMAMNGTLMGAPFFATTAIPKNVGDGDESELYFIDAAHCIIGDALTLEVTESETATYTASDASTRNSFQQDERVIRLVHEVDFVLRHDKAAAYVSDADYGTALDA